MRSVVRSVTIVFWISGRSVLPVSIMRDAHDYEMRSRRFGAVMVIEENESSVWHG
jgi:hypothetical protein